MREKTLLPSNTPASGLEKAKYLAKVGSVMHAIVETRVDITFAISMFSRFTKNPSLEHLNAINQILRYQAGSRERGIKFGEEKELKLVGYFDSDWAGDHADRKPTSGFMFVLNGGQLRNESKKQALVALSCPEAEY